MFTSKFVVRGASNSLKLRIFYAGKMTEVSVPGICVTPEELSNFYAKSCSKYTKIVRCIKEWECNIDLLKCRLINEDTAHLTIKDIRKMVECEVFNIGFDDVEEEKKSDASKFGSYFKAYCATKQKKSYRELCESTLRKMQSLCPDFDELTFDDITLKWLKQLEEKMIKEGASQNSRNIHFKNIRACLNRAIDEEVTANYPFRRFKLRPEATRKRSMTVEELRQLFCYRVQPYQEFYRDMFKLTFMLIGINTVDLHGLTAVTKRGRIEYRRSKTKKLYSVKVEPEAMKIIEKYKGRLGLLTVTDRWKSHRDFQKCCNTALKKIGKLEIKGRGGKKIITPEWPELTMYWARHTWATIAYNDLGISKDIISQALGHSLGSQITEIYIDKDPKLVDDANRKVLDWVLYGRR